jgi:hypothetical protein
MSEEPAKDMHPREDDRNWSGSAVGKADDAQKEQGELEESPVPDPTAKKTGGEDDPEAD